MSRLPDEDDTIRVRHTWSGEPPPASADDAEIDEVTAVSRRRDDASEAPVQVLRNGGNAAAYVAPEIDQAATEPDDGQGRRRSTYIDAPLETEEFTDGSTIVARRESRRRAARADAGGDEPAGPPASRADRRRAAAVAGSPPPVTRLAYAPDADSVASYPARAAQPTIVARTPVAPRSPQSPVDVDAADRGRRRASRRTVGLVAGAASALVLAGGAALVAIVLNF